jgi:hypothetical protein
VKGFRPLRPDAIAALAGRYEKLLACPETRERREVRDALGAAVRARGPLVVGGYRYRWSAVENALFRDPYRPWGGPRRDRRPK